MRRTPEPELMTGEQQALVYAVADFSASDQALVERLFELFPAGLGNVLLDLGCGPGNISFLLARHFTAAQVVGVDGSAAMLRLAKQALAAETALYQRLRFEQCCLPDPGLSGGYSAVVSNSLLHHLHDPQVLWHALPRLGVSGACVYVKDLRRPASARAAIQIQRRYQGDAPAVLQHDYLASLHAAFTPIEVAQQLEQAGLAGQLQVEPLDDRYLEVWGQLN
jgi:trans-aconitate 2-methyltransferase